MQVIRQRLPLGEADDACDLAACGPAHGALQLGQAALLPFTCCCRDGSGRGGRPEAQVHLVLALPLVLSAHTQGLACSSRGGWATSLPSGPALHCVPVGLSQDPSQLWHPLPEPPATPTLFAGLPAAKGGTAVAHAQAVGI